MPQLIHLNGPSGVGKSTIAGMYVDRHPGVLNLDTDQIVSLIGGWRDNFWDVLEAGRLLAISMAETHLRTGHDVVMPQLVTKPDEADRFQAAAERAGARYREIVLMAGRRQMLDRYSGRVLSGDSAPHRHIDEIIARAGGPELLARIHGHLTTYLHGRPDCLLVPTDGRDAAHTYDAVIAALARTRSRRPAQPE